MVVVVETILSIVTNKNIRPPVVIEIADSYAEAPSIIGDACLGCHIGKCSIVIVVEESGMRWGLLSAERIVG